MRGPAPGTSPAQGGAAHTVAQSAHDGTPRLVSIRKDGTDGTVYAVQSELCDIGRYEGDVRLEDDPYLSGRHARIRRHNGRYYLRDLDSVNGVYLRLRDPVELRDGDHFLIGQQVFRYELLGDSEQPLGPARLQGVLAFGTPEVPRFARLVQYTTEGLPRDIYYIYRDETVLGRENGDVVFTDDPFLSRRHAVVTIDRAARRAVLKDLSSSNGTSIRLREEHAVSNGDQFRVGRHLFRFDHPEPGR